MINQDLIYQHINELFGQDMHAKRVLSLANATHAVIEKGSLAIHAIGVLTCYQLKLRLTNKIQIGEITYLVNHPV